MAIAPLHRDLTTGVVDRTDRTGWPYVRVGKGREASGLVAGWMVSLATKPGTQEEEGGRAWLWPAGLKCLWDILLLLSNWQELQMPAAEDRGPGRHRTRDHRVVGVMGVDEIVRGCGLGGEEGYDWHQL